jgi:hypothetical protein
MNPAILSQGRGFRNSYRKPVVAQFEGNFL